MYISGLGAEVEVLRKNVKNLNLRVYPAEPKVRISVPYRIHEEAVVQFINQKVPWIKRHLYNYKRKPRKASLKLIDGEKHLFRGDALELKISEKNKPPQVFTDGNGFLIMQIRPGTNGSKKASLLKEWYRSELKKSIPPLIKKWEPVMNVSVQEFGVKQMKTRWGTCNTRKQRIWLNLELAKKRPALLEYVVVHEMVHLLERLHNKRFYAFMERFLPNWKQLKNELNGKSSISDC